MLWSFCFAMQHVECVIRLKPFPPRRTLLYGIYNHSYAGVDGLKLLASAGPLEEVKEKSDALVPLVPALKRARALSREIGDNEQPCGIQKVSLPRSCFVIQLLQCQNWEKGHYDDGKYDMVYSFWPT